MFKNLFARTTAGNAPMPGKRLQTIAEVFGLPAILLLLASAAAFQLGKWGQRLQSDSLQQWMSWGDAAATAGYLLTAVSLSLLALDRVRGRILRGVS